MVEIKNANASVPESRLKNLENLWGFSLPEPYRSFLAKNNGGYPVPAGFCFKDETSGSSIDRFLGIDIGEYDNLLTYLETYKDRIPKDLFPIAHDPGGNILCIGVCGNNMGRVFFWDHEFEKEEGESPDYSNLTSIADSFAELLQNLEEVDIEGEVQSKQVWVAPKFLKQQQDEGNLA